MVEKELMAVTGVVISGRGLEMQFDRVKVVLQMSEKWK